MIICNALLGASDLVYIHDDNVLKIPIPILRTPEETIL
jgi:hypothetical protein